MPCCVLRFRLFRPAPSPVLFDIAAHRQSFASALGHPAGTVLRFLVFRPGLGSVSPNIAVHRRGSCFMLVDAHLSAPHPHPLTCCWCLILSPPAARRHRRSVCCVFWFFSRLCALFHPISQHTGQVLRLPLGHPVGTVLRFRGIRSAIGLKSQISQHTPRRDAAWMEAQVLGADAGARVRGVWRRPGCRAWVCGGVWKRGEVAHRVWERGCGNAVWGEG